MTRNILNSDKISKMLQENYKIMTELTKCTPRYTSQGLKLFENVIFYFSPFSGLIS